MVRLVVFYVVVTIQQVLNLGPAFNGQPDIVIVGGGSAGLTAAKFGARFGKRVVLVEKDRLGGDCTWTGCVPSKSLISEAKKIHAFRRKVPASRITGRISISEWNDIKDRLKRVVNQIYEADDSPTALQALGIEVVTASASFLNEDTLLLQRSDGNETVSAKYGYIVSTGARPARPTIRGLGEKHGVPFVTYEEIFDIPEIPPRLTVVGGGPIGCELAQTFQRLGCNVTIVAPSLLPAEEVEARVVIERVFKSEGIKHVRGRVVSVEPAAEQKKSHVAFLDNGEQIVGETLLVAAGRNVVVDRLGLDAAGVDFSLREGIRTDDKLRTTSKKIYAAGDCTGGQQFTHVAGFQGAIAARNLLLPLSDPGVTKAPCPSCIFTSPEVARTGFSEAQAREEFGEKHVGVITRSLSEVDRAKCDEDDPEGFIKIIYHTKDFRILGALIVAPPAGEMISEISVAIAGGVKLPDLASIIHPYPSYSIAIQQMAADVYYKQLDKKMGLYNLLKKLGL